MEHFFQGRVEGFTGHIECLPRTEADDRKGFSGGGDDAFYHGCFVNLNENIRRGSKLGKLAENIIEKKVFFPLIAISICLVAGKQLVY
jgi:hypothetical protein